jgi:hypothetical protein
MCVANDGSGFQRFCQQEMLRRQFMNGSLLSSLVLLLCLLGKSHIVESFALNTVTRPSCFVSILQYQVESTVGTTSPRSIGSRPSTGRDHNVKSTLWRSKRGHLIYAKQDESSDSPNNNNNDNNNGSINYTILAADLVGIVLACQLLGLVDVLTDRSFWAQGGWFQPIPAIPASLSVLVGRISENALAVAACSLVVGGYRSSAVASTERLQYIGLRTTILYALSRLLLGVGLGYMLGAPDVTTGNNDVVAAMIALDEAPAWWMVVVGEILREIYCVSLASLAARYILFVLYYR